MTCEACGRKSKRPVIACGRCKKCLPRLLLIDVGLASRLTPMHDYWQMTARAVRHAMDLYWTRKRPKGGVIRRDLRPLKRRERATA